MYRNRISLSGQKNTLLGKCCKIRRRVCSRLRLRGPRGGTVLKLELNGIETVLHSFLGGRDGKRNVRVCGGIFADVLF